MNRFVFALKEVFSSKNRSDISTGVGEGLFIVIAEKMEWVICVGSLKLKIRLWDLKVVIAKKFG